MTSSAVMADELRVCADPSNLPFSNVRGEGFENRIADELGRVLGQSVTYTFSAQHRGFLRNTLKAERCDVVIGVPEGLDMVLHTRPLYRSRYAFVQRPGGAPIRSFDDPRLRTLRVGVQLVGDDGANTPPAHALSRRGIIENVRGFMVQGDYGKETPASAIVDAVADQQLDVAVVWGPVAGYFGAKRNLVVTPVEQDADAGQPMMFTLDAGVRRGDAQRQAEIDRALAGMGARIDAILDEYHVPR